MTTDVREKDNYSMGRPKYSPAYYQKKLEAVGAKKKPLGAPGRSETQESIWSSQMHLLEFQRDMAQWWVDRDAARGKKKRVHLDEVVPDVKEDGTLEWKDKPKAVADIVTDKYKNSDVSWADME
jgi:hypothetical protein